MKLKRNSTRLVSKDFFTHQKLNHITETELVLYDIKNISPNFLNPRETLKVDIKDTYLEKILFILFECLHNFLLIGEEN